MAREYKPQYKRCKVCGHRIRDPYTLCWDCYRKKQGEPKKCKDCGAIIDERYIVCYSCALKRKLIKKDGEGGG
jgi:hypothetical protein